MSEKHPDFKIEPVNTIRPLEIEYSYQGIYLEITQNEHKHPRHWYQLTLLCQLFENTFLDNLT